MTEVWGVTRQGDLDGIPVIELFATEYAANEFLRRYKGVGLGVEYRVTKFRVWRSGQLADASRWGKQPEDLWGK